MEEIKKKILLELETKRLLIISIVISLLSLLWSTFVLVGRYSENLDDFPSGVLDWFSIIGFLIFFSMLGIILYIGFKSKKLHN